jgi:hypothetical protein
MLSFHDCTPTASGFRKRCRPAPRRTLGGEINIFWTPDKWCLFLGFGEFEEADLARDYRVVILDPLS